MLYSGTSSVIIIILGVLGISYFCNKRLRISKSKPINTNENTSQAATTSTRNIEEETVEMADTLYETIDESTLENIVVPNEYSPNLSADNVMGSESTLNRCVSRSSYLKPYNTRKATTKHNQDEILPTKTLILNIAEIRFDQCSCYSDTEDDEDSSSYESTRDCNDDLANYLQPYCSLDTNISNYHIYDE